MNKIIEVRITLLDNGFYEVAVTKAFTSLEDTQVFKESGGIGLHHALDVARGMVTLSPAQRR